jgi:hypothetical protein
MAETGLMDSLWQGHARTLPSLEIRQCQDACRLLRQISPETAVVSFSRT